MQDFIFTRNYPEARVTFRTDRIGTEKNFTVMAITGADEHDITNTQAENEVLKAIKKLPNSLEAFVEFAEDHGLVLSLVTESGIITLVASSNSDSSSY